MAITNFLLQLPNQQTMHLPALRFSSIKWSCSNNNTTIKNNYFPYKIMTSSHTARLKCCIMNYKPELEKGFGGNIDGEMKVDILTSIENFMEALRKSIVTGAFLVLWVLLYDCRRHLALAASGGRMGGSLFDSFSSSSSPSYSSSTSNIWNSSPESSSYSTQTSSPVLPESTSLSSYSYSSSPSSSSPSYSSSSYSYSSSTSNIWNSSPESYSYSTQTSSPVRWESTSTSESNDIFFIMIGFAVICVVGYLLTQSDADKDTAKASVLKLQVGLLGTARTLQKDLNQIAEAADTSTSQGLSYVLQEAALVLLRHPDYCVSGYSSVDMKRGVGATEKRFNQISIEERGKFDEETLVNVNNIRKKIATSQKSNGLRNEYIVVTIIVAASGIHDLPHITNSAQLKKALQNLAIIPSNKIMAAEVLWTPQKENDTLSEQELLEDYSLLRPL